PNARWYSSTVVSDLQRRQVTVLHSPCCWHVRAGAKRWHDATWPSCGWRRASRVIEKMIAPRARRSAQFLGLAALALTSNITQATETFRALSPSKDAPNSAVLLVPGCSGFVARNGINHYEERASELQAAGYFVVFVDYLSLSLADLGCVCESILHTLPD